MNSKIINIVVAISIAGSCFAMGKYSHTENEVNTTYMKGGAANAIEEKDVGVLDSIVTTSVSDAKPLVKPIAIKSMNKVPKYRVLSGDSIIYEGDVPYDVAYPGPAKIVHTGKSNPTIEELTKRVDGWINSVFYIPISVEDLVTDADRERVEGATEIRLVDNRFMLVFRSRGDNPRSEHNMNIVDKYCELSHCLNRTSKEYSGEAVNTLYRVPAIADLREELNELEEVIDGSWVISTVPVSFETIHNIGGDNQ